LAPHLAPWVLVSFANQIYRQLLAATGPRQSTELVDAGRVAKTSVLQCICVLAGAAAA